MRSKNNGIVKVPIGTGPVPTRGTKGNDRDIHSKPMDKGRSGRKVPTLPPGKIVKPSKHGFMPYVSEHMR